MLTQNLFDLSQADSGECDILKVGSTGNCYTSCILSFAGQSGSISPVVDYNQILLDHHYSCQSQAYFLQ